MKGISSSCLLSPNRFDILQQNAQVNKGISRRTLNTLQTFRNEKAFKNKYKLPLFHLRLQLATGRNQLYFDYLSHTKLNAALRLVLQCHTPLIFNQTLTGYEQEQMLYLRSIIFRVFTNEPTFKRWKYTPLASKLPLLFFPSHSI